MSALIASTRVVTGDTGPEARPLTLLVEQGRIAEVRPGIDPRAEVVDAWVVPGFVDTHCHGGAGCDLAADDPAGVSASIDFHRRHGSTTLFASTVTEPVDEVLTQIGRLRPLVEAGELDGIHLEGPFLSEAKKGAHNASLLVDPADDIVERILQASGGTVRMVTLAPERGNGIQATMALSEAGVAVAFGHSDADEVTTRASVDAGASVVTHLFNAMRPIHHREPGPIPFLLSDDRVMVELICDGTHLHPDVIAMAVEAAGIHRVGLVTDAMSATGQPDGDYRLGSLTVAVRDGVAKLLGDDGTLGAIAGSTLTMAGAVEYVVGTVGREVGEAAIMAATTPARWHGLDEVGQLVAGRHADLCVVDDSGALLRVMRRGDWLEGVGA
ncbi:N-acetylglucosamine-6-phosphate deacetylase [Propionibacteriaceae bacterium G1746]|uniref:N-acetylglucosamine-6-phosphate deacetylase n=1 Tax=Aestuariimicrobium sp. G57 TaxID=3418485 RepID=UPI003C25E8D4